MSWDQFCKLKLNTNQNGYKKIYEYRQTARTKQQIVISAMQRYTADQVTPNSSSVVQPQMKK